LSLVEMMVGVAVGLFIVAGATTLAASQLSENRRLLLETQVQQDLRASADIITRELRRAGYDSHAEFLIWSADAPTADPRANIWAGLRLGANDDVVSYGYDRPGSTTTDFGDRLTGGTIKQRLGSTTQDLTDRNTLEVTAFTVTLENTAGEQLACPRLCDDGTQACWPTQAVVDATVTIAGRAVTDASVSRTIVSRLRLRNDALKFNVSSTKVCP
jgi:type IV pilus assembly protein PilW